MTRVGIDRAKLAWKACITDKHTLLMFLSQPRILIQCNIDYVVILSTRRLPVYGFVVLLAMVQACLI